MPRRRSRVVVLGLTMTGSACAFAAHSMVQALHDRTQAHAAVLCVRSSRRATVCAPVQDSENTMAVALKFLHAVRQSCGGDGSKTYTTFLRLLRNFDRGAVGIDKVVSTTRRLFKDHADLMIVRTAMRAARVDGG